MTSGLRQVPDLGRIAEQQPVGEQHRAHRAVGDDRGVRIDQLAPALARGPAVRAQPLVETRERGRIERLGFDRRAVQDPSRSHLGVPLVVGSPDECSAASLESAAYAAGATA